MSTKIALWFCVMDLSSVSKMMRSTIFPCTWCKRAKPRVQRRSGRGPRGVGNLICLCSVPNAVPRHSCVHSIGYQGKKHKQAAVRLGQMLRKVSGEHCSTSRVHMWQHGPISTFIRCCKLVFFFPLLAWILALCSHLSPFFLNAGSVV